MSAEILISVRPGETRVAYVEGGMLSDLKIEKTANPTLVGAIFRGRVLRVLPGMQAAFVDIGLDRAAFLYVGDVRKDLDTSLNSLLEEAEDPTDNPESSLTEDSGMESTSSAAEKPRIQELLTEGQSIMVQVAKDPLGTKGARITTHISLPGRHLVYMPTLSHIGVSRRIADAAERDRLKAIVTDLQPSGGVIVRTAGEGAKDQSLKADLDYLNRLWGEIQRAYEKRSRPGSIHSELEVELRALRDLLHDGVAKIIVDDDEAQRRILNFLGQFMPRFRSRVSLYRDPRPLFDHAGVDIEIARSLERKIWLKSGGYIVFDEAEALVVIDVNTGRFVGKKDLEDTILKTNLEAVREIAHQLRIRNCGGIIIVDFIDMERPSHREKVLEALTKELAKDRSRTTVASMSSLGLVEMTRKRTRPSLVKALCEPCRECEGKAYVKRASTIVREIFRDLERDVRPHGGGSVVVHCHAEIADHVYAELSEALDAVEKRIGKHIIFRVEPEFHRERYQLSAEIAENP